MVLKRNRWIDFWESNFPEKTHAARQTPVKKVDEVLHIKLIMDTVARRCSVCD